MMANNRRQRKIIIIIIMDTFCILKRGKDLPAMNLHLPNEPKVQNNSNGKYYLNYTFT